MAIYNRDPVMPEWEPAPADLPEDVADEQERGFHRRATAPIVWKKIPSTGAFGHKHDWFVSNEVELIATHDGEDLLLHRFFWHGFPDPPEWALASRPAGRHNEKWVTWGHFPRLPAAWVAPEEECGSPDSPRR
jgi:hypothetical protein